MVRAHASHQYGPGSVHRPGVSMCLKFAVFVLSLVREVFLRVLSVFILLQKPTLPVRSGMHVHISVNELLSTRKVFVGKFHFHFPLPFPWT